MKLSQAKAIILCGGKGLRTGSAKNKVLCYFGIKTALEYCLDALSPFCDKLIVVAAKADEDEINYIAGKYNAKVVPGGETRTESVKNGLSALDSSDDIVLIHDAARPFVSQETVAACINSALEFGSGIAAVKVTDTVKRVKDGSIVSEVNRDDLYYMQTPQAFRLSQIKTAYDGINATYNDDSAVYSAAGFTPRIVLSSADNKKITTPEDLLSPPPCQKIGTGIDFHRLTEGRPLIIGGVNIPFDKGLLGHSDADVLVHAVMDALLSAINEPDIGVLFPSTIEFKGASSIDLLKTVIERVNKSGRKIISVSATIMAQVPKMRPHIPQMIKILADTMKIEADKINITATTTEGLGVIGKGDGIAASAVCMLQ